MKFSVNQKDLQNSLNYCQGVIENRSTLPILSNVLLEAKDANLRITATDLDLIFIQNISNIVQYIIYLFTMCVIILYSLSLRIHVYLYMYYIFIHWYSIYYNILLYYY